MGEYLRHGSGDEHPLRGGEGQRVQLARVLAQEPSILVLDEPTSHLDIRHPLKLMSLISSLCVTTLITLHEINLAPSCYDRFYALSNGDVEAVGPAADVLTSKLLRRVLGIDALAIVNPLTSCLSEATEP